MVSFAPTSEETLEDQRLYTQARLTEVACLDCLAKVGVKKNSEHHTSIQWDAESLAACGVPQDGPSRVGGTSTRLLAAALARSTAPSPRASRDRGPGWLLTPSS